MLPRHPARPSRHAQGFTLIELIVVIIILGVLAAAALPKFMDMQRDARLAKLQALQGTLISTAQQLHSLCMLQYAHCSESYGYNTVLSGQTESIHVKAFDRKILIHYGWPSPFSGWGASTGHWAIDGALNLEGFTVLPYVSGSYEREFRITDAPDPGTCKVTYRVALWAPNLNPTYAITSTGC